MVSPTLFAAYLERAEAVKADTRLPIERRAAAARAVDSCLAVLAAEGLTRDDLADLARDEVAAVEADIGIKLAISSLSA